MEPQKVEIELDDEMRAAMAAMERDLSQSHMGQEILPVAKGIYTTLLAQPNDQMALMNICCSLAANTVAMNNLADQMDNAEQIVHNIVSQIDKLQEINKTQSESIKALKNKLNQ